MGKKPAFCCNDLQDYVEYLQSFDKQAEQKLLGGSETGKFKSFTLCPFCGNNLKLLQKSLEKGKSYKIKWDDGLTVGVPWIDNQHKKLLERVNALLNSIIHDDNYDEVGKSVKFLENYVKAHFGTEEGLMQKQYYPGYDVQKRQHELFIKKIHDFSEMHEKSGSSKELAMQVARELWRWFKGHILKKDQEYGDFLRTKGILHDEESTDKMLNNIMAGFEETKP